METPEYIQIIRRQLAASPPSSRAADDGVKQIPQNAIIAPAQAGSGSAPLEALTKMSGKCQDNPPVPAADVAGEAAAPAADVAALPVSPASRRPEASATSVAACSAGVSPAGAGKGLPAPWQELDPRAYQPRPFGPMETDPDWPGKPEEEDPLPPAPAVSTPVNAGGGWAIRQVDASGGLAIAPPSGDPLPDLEDVCWLCEDEAEFYDPSGQAWCSFCIAEAGKSEGWQDLLDLLPASWQRRAESNRQLAAYAAAHYHGAGRRKIALRWSQPPFHQTLQGADLFRAFARWLAAPERWKQREAERQLERLVEHQGLGV